MSDSRVKVMLDVSSVPFGRGVSRYTSNLAVALSQRLDIDLTLFGYSLRQYGFLQNWARQFPPEVHQKLWKMPPSWLEKMWNVGAVPSPVGNVDVYHAWESQQPRLGNQPWVVTVHDLAYKIFPEAAHPKAAARYDRLITRLEKSAAAHAIAVSHATKADMLKFTKIPEERIHVVHEALPHESQYDPTAEEQKKTLRRFHLEKPFILFVGTAEPRKNLPNMIEAWRKVKKDFDFVIAGSPGWSKLEEEDGLHILGYVDPTELASLYRNAHALLYVSLYEGFGLPILEAYFHGCPVITSRAPGLMEIGGKPALYALPNEPEGISEMILALEPKDSRARARRQQDMIDVLKNFSWQRAASETVDVYRIAAEGAK